MGELYLEYHRGTYTSHGSIKLHNRKSEVLLKELEYLATLASLQSVDQKYLYPKVSIISQRRSHAKTVSSIGRD